MPEFFLSRFHRLASSLAAASFAALPVAAPAPALVESAAGFEAHTSVALGSLYETTPGAGEPTAKAEAILVFPNIVMAGFVFDQKGLRAGIGIQGAGLTRIFR